MFIVKFLWMFSMLGYLAVLLLTYLFLPLGVKVFAETDGSPILSLGREAYFWVGLGAVLLVNALVQLLGNLTLFLPFSPFPKSGQWMSQPYLRKRLKRNFKRWLKGLALIINLFLSLSLLHLYTLNDSDVSLNLNLFFYGVGVLFMGWLVFFFVWFNDPEDRMDLG
ncbi:MAG: hypothetical protein ACFCUI_02910 [Bernardetiaceae bacterium]